MSRRLCERIGIPADAVLGIAEELTAAIGPDWSGLSGSSLDLFFDRLSDEGAEVEEVDDADVRKIMIWARRELGLEPAVDDDE